MPPNGSRLSCGRSARGRKELEPQTKRAGQGDNATLPYLRAPGSFKRMSGGALLFSKPPSKVKEQNGESE